MDAFAVGSFLHWLARFDSDYHPGKVWGCNGRECGLQLTRFVERARGMGDRPLVWKSRTGSGFRCLPGAPSRCRLVVRGDPPAVYVNQRDEEGGKGKKGDKGGNVSDQNPGFARELLNEAGPGRNLASTMPPAPLAPDFFDALLIKNYSLNHNCDSVCEDDAFICFSSRIANIGFQGKRGGAIAGPQSFTHLRVSRIQ